MLEDLYSRRIVGWQVLDAESAEAAALLVERTCAALDLDASNLRLHSSRDGLNESSRVN